MRLTYAPLRLLVTGLVALSATTLTGCGGGSSADVVVSAAHSGTLKIAPAGTGSIMAGVDQAVVVERRATVTSVDIVEGAEVQAGQQLLAVYTIGDSGAVATATNELRADEKELASVRARDGVGAATTIALLDKVAEDRQALTDLKSSPTSVTAPAAGRISGLSVEVGAQLTRTDVVLHVIDDRTLRVTVPIAAQYINLIIDGQSAALSLPGGSGASFDAQVVSVGASTTSGSGAVDTVPVTVELPNPTTALPLGSTAYVRFAMDHQASVAVNSLAVLGSGQQPYVFIVADGQVEQRAVVTGVTDGTSTEILGGLAAGEDVVISGGRELATGDSVKPLRADA